FVHRLAHLIHASFRPRLAAVALALSLGLHLHQVGRRTCTSKLLNMPSTQLGGSNRRNSERRCLRCSKSLGLPKPLQRRTRDFRSCFELRPGNSWRSVRTYAALPISPHSITSPPTTLLKWNSRTEFASGSGRINFAKISSEVAFREARRMAPFK